MTSKTFSLITWALVVILGMSTGVFAWQFSQAKKELTNQELAIKELRKEIVRLTVQSDKEQNKQKKAEIPLNIGDIDTSNWKTYGNF